MVRVDEGELWTKQKKIEVKTKNYWAKLRVKNQNESQYYDVLAGKRNKEPHIHFGFGLLRNLKFDIHRDQVTSVEKSVKSEMHGELPPERVDLTEKGGKVNLMFTSTIIGDTKESAISVFGLKEIEA